MRSTRSATAASVAAACVMAILAGQSVQAQTYSVLHTFKGRSGGAIPNAVIQDAKGNLYGTTEYGGGTSDGGTVFRLSQRGNVTVLYKFKNVAHGQNPYAGVIEDAQGSLYGTTAYGGGTACPGGCGTVFKLSNTGKETVLHSFTGGADGAFPNAVIEDTQGNLYGTAYAGGDTACVGGCGTVFKLSRMGKETVLYSFKGGADGENPNAVILDEKGNLYGTTTYDGGRGCGGYGCGVVFKVDTTGRETVLYSFKGGTDGGNPLAGVIRDAKGNLYGTTYIGGASGGGTVFKLNTAGKETVLHSFGLGADGYNPNAGVIRDAEGNLYGTTYYGGASSAGTAFKLSPRGKETILHNFTVGTSGGNPTAAMIQDAKGNLYGATSAGGDLSCGIEGSGCGVVFKLTP
jgi:uncharacterized repeat protein (TIGR03803 family)